MALATLAATGLLAFNLPFSAHALLSFIQLRLRPDKARTEQMIQLWNPATQQTVFLLGTIHHEHYKRPGYSIWHLKAVVTGLPVDAVFIEMMSEAVEQERLGEGPVEMPFVALCAKEAGLRVFGVDSDWEGGWLSRQDRMYGQVRRNLSSEERALIVSGFMHLPHFQRQLEGDGFVVVPWSEAAKREIIDRPIERTWPIGLKEALESAILRAQAGQLETDANWFVQIRRQVLTQMPRR